MDINDFGDEARKYGEWLKENAGDLRILQYGFRLEKKELNEYVVSDHVDNVLDRVEQDVKSKEDPFSAVLLGVDDPWEVCLLKLMVELVQHSASENIQDIQKLALSRQKTLNQRIEQAFLDASRNPALITDLADMLKVNGLWNQNEDRFFALVKASDQ